MPPPPSRPCYMRGHQVGTAVEGGTTALFNWAKMTDFERVFNLKLPNGFFEDNIRIKNNPFWIWNNRLL